MQSSEEAEKWKLHSAFLRRTLATTILINTPPNANPQTHLLTLLATRAQALLHENRTLASNASYHNETSGIRSSIEELSSTRDTLQSEIEKQNSTLQALNEEGDKLRAKNRTLMKKCETKEESRKRIRFLEKKLLDKTTELEKEREQRQTATGIEEKVAELQETVVACQMREKQAVEEAMAECQIRENQLIEELEAVKQRVGNMDQEIGNQQEELDRRLERIASLEEENERLRTVKEAMSMEVERTKLRIYELEKEAEGQTREKIMELEEEIEERERLAVKIFEDRKRDEKKRMELEKALGEVMKQVEEVKTRTTKRELRMEDVLKECYQKAAKAQKACKAKQWRKERVRENEKWQQDIEDLETRANALDERERNIEGLEAREKELETRDKELERREKELRTREKELGAVDHDVEQREKNMELLEEWKKEVERTESQEKKTEKLMKQVEDLKTIIQVLEQRAEALEERENSPETPSDQLTEELQTENLPDLETRLGLVKITDGRLESRKRTINLESTSSEDSATTNTTTVKRLKTAKISGQTLSASSYNLITTPCSEMPSIIPPSSPQPKSDSQKLIPSLSRPLGTLGFAGSSILISSCPEQISRVTVGLLSSNTATPLSISTALNLVIPRLVEPLTPADAELVVNILRGVLKRIYDISLVHARGETTPLKSHADDRNEFTGVLVQVLKNSPIPVLMGFYEQLFKMLKECVMKHDIETRRTCWPEKEVDITEANAAKEAGAYYLRVLEKTWNSEGLKVESAKSITSDDLMMLCVVEGPLVEGVVKVVGAEKVIEIWGAGGELKCIKEI
ncbi:hypothetical protein BZA77DRAFT_368912 [Pyronema omphalodes]|nr:hypothetical protein BZA77DRAFT_368912 [Pyronema omphalodes]